MRLRNPVQPAPAVAESPGSPALRGRCAANGIGLAPAAPPCAVGRVRQLGDRRFRLRRSGFKFPAAPCCAHLRLSDGGQPSALAGPRAWHDQRQKLKRSRWVAISPSGVKVKVPSMMLCTVRPVALKR